MSPSSPGSEPTTTRSRPSPSVVAVIPELTLLSVIRGNPDPRRRSQPITTRAHIGNLRDSKGRPSMHFSQYRGSIAGKWTNRRATYAEELFATRYRVASATVNIRE